MYTVDIGDKSKGRDNKLNTSTQRKSENIVNSDLAMELFINLVFAIPIVMYRGFKFIIKKMRKTA